MTKKAILFKVSIWLIIIGSIALLTPQPAWPEWLARMTLSTGIALLILLLWIKKPR